MSKKRKELYEFGQFRLDVSEHQLERIDGAASGALPEKAFQTLCILVQNRGHLLTKRELMDMVWPDSFVEENNIDKCIYAIRQCLGEKQGGLKFIETVPKHGYRFIADVKELETPEEALENLLESEFLTEQTALKSTSRPTISSTTTESGAFVVSAKWPGEEALVLKNGNEVPDLTESDRQALPKHWRLRRLVVAAVLLIVAIGGLGFGFYRYINGDRGPASLVFSNVTRLTSNGNSSYPAISPDGKYVAYVLREAGKQMLSIQLMHLETGVSRQIFMPSEYRDIVHISFSPDGNYIYFAQSETYGNGPVRGLYRMSVLGGIPTRVVLNVSWYAVSRDGTQLAFVRYSDASDILIASADGSDERILVSHALSEPFSYLHWSSDGRSIAVSVGRREISGDRMYPVIVSVDDGSEKPITPERWQYISYLFWLADGSGLIVSGTQADSFGIGAWRILLPGGDVHPLTGFIDMFAISGQRVDSKMLVGQSVRMESNIWAAPIGEGESAAALARQITTGNDGNYVSCMPDGRLLFTNENIKRKSDIWIMHADGTGRTQLTDDSSSNGVPVASADGRYIVFESDRAGKFNIWRMEADGSDPKQLTFGENEKSPYVSPDGKWVIYTSGDDSTLWRSPLAGGEPQQLTQRHWRGAAISPDGKWIISTAGSRFGLLPIDAGEAVRMFDLPAGVETSGYPGRFTPNSRAFIFVGRRDGIWNIWKQQISGGQPFQITDFQSTDQIRSPNFMPDGKQIVFARGDWKFDIYLIRDFE